MKEKNLLLEKILEKSCKYNVPATEIFIEYYNGRYIGLQDHVVFQYIDMKYQNNITNESISKQK